MVGARPGPAGRLRDRLPFVDYFLPPSDPSPLTDAIPAADDEAITLDARERRERAAAQNGGPRRFGSGVPGVAAHVAVVLGCSHACAYCVIPYRRGRERSRPAEAILDEVRGLADAGVREVMLLGQIVDRYGQDLPGGLDLAGLLRRVAGIEGLMRVRFLTSHPSYLSDAILDAIAETPKICPHVEMPAQSGDDTVLARMRRGYTADEYRRRVDRIRARLPGVAVHSDFIVGFPGETAEQFARTLRMVEELRFDKTHLAKYSERPETLAARRFPDDVPPEEKDRRLDALEAAQRRVQADVNRRYQDRIVRVLVEARDESRGRWRGRTPDNRLVFFTSDEFLLGREADVRIAWTGPYSLIGEGIPPPEVPSS